MNAAPPKVMIECPHLVTVQMGRQFSCNMCGSVWGGSPYPDNWDERVARAAAYEERKSKRWQWLKNLINRFSKTQ